MAENSRRHLIDTLFHDARRREVVPAEAVLMRQGERNTRLYLVRKGELTGYRELDDGSRLPVLSFHHGELVGIQSIFLNDYVSTLTIRARKDSELAWIDLLNERPDDLEKRIIPLLVRALLKRQEQALSQAERDRVEQLRAKELEQMGFLGQMAAAVAHELNNALAVVARGGEWLGSEVEHLASQRPPLEAAAFRQGWEHGRPLINRDELRAHSSRLRKQGFDFAMARRIAQMNPHQAMMPLLRQAGSEEVYAALRAWELGATLKDMAIASRQAAHVVSTLKKLGASDRLREETTTIDDSITDALTIIGHKLSPVSVDLKLDCAQPFTGNQGELIQIWSNLISNACEAMSTGSRPPELHISSCGDGKMAEVRIRDNGPGIPAELRHRIFEPNVTTKKAGLSFGLGLGLAVVKRLVTLYHGHIQVHSSDQGSKFVVRLPLN